MSLNADQARVVWADEDGEFLLCGGGFGNPGCDGCGTADAVVAVDGTYLCGSEAVANADRYGLELCAGCGGLAGSDPTITVAGDPVCAGCTPAG